MLTVLELQWRSTTSLKALANSYIAEMMPTWEEVAKCGWFKTEANIIQKKEG